MVNWFTALAGGMLCASQAAETEFQMSLGLLPGPESHEICWSTRAGYNYELQVSEDLGAWSPTGVIVAGDGTGVCHPVPVDAPQRYFRVRETTDAHAGAFLLLPEPDTEVDLHEGVCFAFDLDVLDALPSKIHIYQRTAGTSDWEIIGTLTEFTEIDGIRLLRGSAIWIAPSPGCYEVQAAVVDAAGLVTATATRHVDIGQNEAPQIVITSGPVSPSANSQTATFGTTVTDSEDDIAKVEFYDNGELIGTDKVPPYGDEIVPVGGGRNSLYRGLHSITAKAYDTRGAVGETAQAYELEITGGNARPELTITGPAPGSTIAVGDPLTLHFTASDPDGPSDLLRIDAVDLATLEKISDQVPPFDNLTFDTTGWQPGTHTIRLYATDVGGAESRPRELQLYLDDTGTGPTFARELALQISDPVSAAPSNESFTGVEASTSPFSGGVASGMQLDDGIILTSGLAELWNGGDASEGASESLDAGFQNYREPGDPLLEQYVAGFETFDAASLEFDVFSTNGQLEIEYQFGSEEYDEWVNSYNDAFLITINGVVSSFVPDCSDIVAVSSVNQVTPANEHLFLDDDDDILPLVAEPNHGSRVEYDGMIARLRVFAFVTPNQTHRVRLVIGDVNDDQLDSALMVGSVLSRPAFR